MPGTFPQPPGVKPKDYFEELQEQVEHEAIGMRGRRPAIEREACFAAGYYDPDVSDGIKARLTVDHLVNASVWASQQGKPVVAMAALRVALEIEPANWKAHYNLGWHYLELGRKFRGEIRLDEPESFDRVVAVQTAFYQAALKHTERACELDPGNAKLWCLLGQTQYYLEDHDQARLTLGKAIAMDPGGEGGRAAANALAILENTVNRK